MSKTKFFCFGFGQVAESFINKLIDEKKDFDLSVTSRQETHQIEFNNLKIDSFQFTKEKFDSSIISKLQEADCILISIPPIEGEDIVANFFDTNQKFKRLLGIPDIPATIVVYNQKIIYRNISYSSRQENEILKFINDYKNEIN